MTSLLNNVKKANAKHNPLIVIYGSSGIGKTSLASEFPNTLFLQTEEGVPVDSDIYSPGLIRKYQVLKDYLNALNSEEHDYKTIVIDSITALQSLMNDYICNKNGWKSIESPGFGAGYTAILEEWCLLLRFINNMKRKKDLTFILIGHAIIENFNDPMYGISSRYYIDTPKRCKSIIEMEADVILFLNKNVKDKNVTIHTTTSIGYVAKNRYCMKDKITYYKGKGYDVLKHYFDIKPNISNLDKSSIQNNDNQNEIDQSKEINNVDIDHNMDRNMLITVEEQVPCNTH